MGQIFELVADHALEKLDKHYDECHICEAIDVDLYSYQGVLTLPDGRTDDDIYVACATCIRLKPLRHTGEQYYTRTIEKYVDSLDRLTEDTKRMLIDALISKSRQTPDIPMFLQGVDRPLCCGDITEFRGYPIKNDELYLVSDQDIYWEEGVKGKVSTYDFRANGGPESLREVARFACRHCGKKYFTFQFT